MTLQRTDLVLFLILLLTGLLGCQQKDPLITGKITEIAESRFLVISDIEKLSSEEPDAVWFTTGDMTSLKIGQTVSVWATNIDDSYPGQAEADKIKIKD